jgi:hypothetical protein
MVNVNIILSITPAAPIVPPFQNRKPECSPMRRLEIVKVFSGRHPYLFGAMPIDRNRPAAAVPIGAFGAGNDPFSQVIHGNMSVCRPHFPFDGFDVFCPGTEPLSVHPGRKGHFTISIS